MSLSQILKSRRTRLGYTLLDVAKRMGVTEATVQRWESGNIKNLPHKRIVKLAEVLEISPTELMGWNCEKPEPLDDEMQDYINVLHSRPEMKVLFSKSRKATKEQIEKTLKILDALSDE